MVIYNAFMRMVLVVVFRSVSYVIREALVYKTIYHWTDVVTKMNSTVMMKISLLNILLTFSKKS